MTEDFISWHDGPCGLVACHNENQHGHLRCPACGSITFRNTGCEVCVAAWGGNIPDANVPFTLAVSDLTARHRAVPCPICDAPVGQLCRNKRGKAIREHGYRKMLATLVRNDFGWVDRG